MRSFTSACLVGRCLDFQSTSLRELGNKPSYKDIKLINNISRKGLVVGTVAALALSSISAAPAFAATVGTGSAVATTYSGTGTSIVEGTDFDVTVFADPAKAYWSQTSASGYAFTSSTITRYTFTNYTAGGEATSSYYQWLPTGSATVDPWSNNGEGWDDPAGVYITDAVAASVATSVGFTASTSGNSIDASTPGDTTFTLTGTSITADTEVTYTPFISTDATGAYDAADGDITGTPIVVKYLNNTGTVLTAALTGTVTGVTNQDVKVSVTGPTGVNMLQMDDDLEVLVSRSQTYIDDSDLTTTDNVAVSQTWNLGTGYYTARVYNMAGSSPADNTVAFSALTTETIVGQQSPDSKIVGIELKRDASANMDENGYVREGTKSFDVAAQIYTTDGSDDGNSNDAYAKAGVSIKFTADLDSSVEGQEIKINGTVITSSGVSVTVPTDSNGVAKVTIVSKNGANGEDIEVRAEVLTADGIYWDSDQWYWESVNFDSIWETKGVGLNDVYLWEDGYEIEDSAFVLGTTRNASVTLNYEVTDQFAQPFAKSGYEYQVRVYNYDNETLLGTGALVNGKAAVTFVNQELAGSEYLVYGVLEQRATNVLSPTWNEIGYDEYTLIHVNHSNTVGSLSAKAQLQADERITYADFFDYNFNVAGTENTAFEDSHLDEDGYDRIEGTVVDANNVPLAGVAVTVSAAGVQFSDHELYKVGSITVYTDRNGYYEVEYYSHKAGDNLFTVTSGGKSATTTVTLNNPTALHASDVLTVNAPAAVQAGTVTPVRVQLVDKYGNGITGAAIALGLVGEGYLSNYSVTTDKGVASVVLINGVNDTSSAYISAATAHASVDSWMNRDNKSFTQKVITGSYATVKASSVKGRLNVVVDNSRNETVRVFVDGKLAKKVVANSGKFTVKVNGLKKGKHKVTVTSDYQNLVTSKSVTIK